MRKLVAIVCVISWSGFWAFGYLALAAEPGNSDDVIVALVLAAAAFLVGVFTYIRLAQDGGHEQWKRVRQSEGA
ncbi:MAG: hypothetical protein IAE87_03200 [Rhodobacteraceae bacterium]|jgi:hypothetical protein|nr:hypothetical protein [Paracoccaceae bacterium]